MDRAAGAIQATYKSHNLRVRAIMNTQATIIQSAIMGYLARKETKAMKDAIKSIQQIYKSFKIRQQLNTGVSNCNSDLSYNSTEIIYFNREVQLLEVVLSHLTNIRLLKRKPQQLLHRPSVHIKFANLSKRTALKSIWKHWKKLLE